MKFYCLALTLLLCLPLITYAQQTLSPVYVKIYGAYGFISPGSFTGEPSKFTSRIDTGAFSVARKGLGEGLRTGGGIGVIVSDYINVGIDFEYHSSSTLKSETRSSEGDVNIRSSTSINYAMSSIIPNVTFKAVTRPAYHVYCRAGLVIAIPNNITEDYDYAAVQYISGIIPNRKVRRTTIRSHAIYALKTGIGYQVSLGAQFSITPHIRAFAEISGYRLALNRERFEELTKNKRTATESERPITPDADNDAITDLSRVIINYKAEGKQTVDYSGVPANRVYTYVQPQKQININSVAAGIGLLYRF